MVYLIVGFDVFGFVLVVVIGIEVVGKMWEVVV